MNSTYAKVQRIESINTAKCIQCGEWFYYQRKTSKFCSPACRKQCSRGVVPSDKYKNGLFSEDEKIVAMIAEKSPLAFRKIEYIKNHYGKAAMDRTIEIIKILGIADGH